MFFLLRLAVFYRKYEPQRRYLEEKGAEPVSHENCKVVVALDMEAARLLK